MHSFRSNSSTILEVDYVSNPPFLSVEFDVKLPSTLKVRIAYGTNNGFGSTTNRYKDGETIRKILVIKGADFCVVAVGKVIPAAGKIAITILVSPSGGGSVTGSRNDDEGSTVTIQRQVVTYSSCGVMVILMPHVKLQ